ncbi:hypothetical protein G5B40_17350 [Pikeienuella piscinae]|uniref:SGNH hydrolase-type esterase domain-containing protein n=1 Tax=Pikeienuella piscinae TaxID=2748098 RepID=A0A7L5C512_9RHOB|nr:SGNH/GDSL hydrolase family protein [Pikeienuella piscinae]QIE57049.1 hypothetical protein G5B40_17350 [Pikeienuella piscinae]
MALLALFVVLGAVGFWIVRLLLAYGAFGAPEHPQGDRPAAVAAARCASPDCPATVTLLGTSLLAHGAWRDALEQRLDACRGGPVTLRVIVKPGASSDWGRTQMDGLFDSDAIIVDFAVNDASLWRGVTLERSRENHLALIDAAEANGVAIFLATMNPAFALKAAVRPGRPVYHDLYRELADETGAGLIDDAPRWAARDDAWLRAAIPDDLHPTNAAMTEITLPSFARTLTPLICSS